MHITRGSDYGLRGLLYLAKQPPDRLVMAGEIAAAENMPEYFFAKIFQNLVRAGLINSFRGSSGGFSLAKSPEEITVRKVIEVIEGPFAFTKCLEAPGECEKSSTCPFHSYWQEAQESLISVLDKYTLADAASYNGPSAQKDWISGGDLRFSP